jgi:hypothetical protein
VGRGSATAFVAFISITAFEHIAHHVLQCSVTVALVKRLRKSLLLLIARRVSQAFSPSVSSYTQQIFRWVLGISFLCVLVAIPVDTTYESAIKPAGARTT